MNAQKRKDLRDSRLSLADNSLNGWPTMLSAKTTDGKARGVNAHTARLLMDRWREEIQPVKDSDSLRVITAMPEDTFAKVVNDRWKSFWETGPTWHLKYATEEVTPEQARRYNENRLFGGVCPDLCHGTLFWPGMQNEGEVRDYLLSNFGNVLVTWKREVWETGSVTYGDSQQNIMAWPFSMENINKLVVGHATDFGMRVCPWVFLPDAVGLENRNPYIEFQIHGGGLSSSHMQDVEVVQI